MQATLSVLHNSILIIIAYFLKYAKYGQKYKKYDTLLEFGNILMSYPFLFVNYLFSNTYLSNNMT